MYMYTRESAEIVRLTVGNGRHVHGNVTIQLISPSVMLACTKGVGGRNCGILWYTRTV